MLTTNCAFDCSFDTTLLGPKLPTLNIQDPDNAVRTGVRDPEDFRNSEWNAMLDGRESDMTDTGPTSVAETVEATIDDVQERSQIFQEGALLCGTYRVGELIGTGGMSQILEAYDTHRQRTVAIKVCKAGVSSSYLYREAELLESFSHSSIVAIHDICTHAGVDFLVMERLQGETLRDRIERGERARSIEEAIDLLISLCEAVSLLHENGIIHRDLKPSNIMLTHDDRLVLLDFGVAISEEQMHGALGRAGSPLYMAPESVTCYMRHELSPLVDIYSLGCMAYELLTGRVPFTGNSQECVLSQHLHGSTPSVSEQVEVPRALDRLIARMMSKSPEERPQSAELVARLLRDMRASSNKEGVRMFRGTTHGPGRRRHRSPGAATRSARA